MHYAFYCDQSIRLFYTITIIILGILTIFVTISKHYAGHAFRPLRVKLFVMLGSMGIFPTVHHVLIHGYETSRSSISLDRVFAMLTCCVIGVFLFVNRIPERWNPGGFDIFGHSHQWWHICIVLAILCHLVGLYEMMHYWHSRTCNI